MGGRPMEESRQGLNLLMRAAQAYVASVRVHVIDRPSKNEPASLASALEKLGFFGRLVTVRVFHNISLGVLCRKQTRTNPDGRSDH